MKKLSTLLIAALLIMAGCGNEETKETAENNLTFESFIQAFEEEGLEVELEEDKPMYSLIGAKDGIMFYSDGKVAKIYQYSTSKEIEEGEKELPAMEDWERNGLYVLETSNEEIKEIFKNTK